MQNDCGVMTITARNGLGDACSNPAKRAETLGNGLNLTILPRNMGK